MKNETRLIAGITFIVSLAVYIITIAPTVSLWDCGEFITCSYIMGVPHPPGTPLYVMIGRLFTLFPFSNIAVRVNFVSALSSAFVVMILFLVIVRLIKEWRGNPQTVSDKIIVIGAAFIGAMSYAFSDSFWFNAVEAEVYAMSMLFTALVLWLAVVWMDNNEDYKSVRFLLLILYLFGLGAGVHLLNLLVIPTIFLLVLFTNRKLLLRYDLWCLVPILIIIGYSTYLMIYIRSGLDPAIDMNNPETLENFRKYLRREQYGTKSQFSLLFDRAAPLWTYQIKKMFVRYFGWQFIGKGTTYGADGYIKEILTLRGLYAIPFVFGVIGMVYHLIKDWKRGFSIFTLFIVTGIILVIYLNQKDPQPRERDYVYVACSFAFAIWIGMGALAVLEGIAYIFKQKRGLYAVGGTFVVLLLICPGNMFRFNFHTHDRSGQYLAWDFAHNLLQSCEQNAILVTNGDNDTFPLWYLQEVENIRKDINVVNLSLLNTPWYILQLKHREPKVPINMTDENIKRLGGYFKLDKAMTVKIVIDPRLFRHYLREMDGIIQYPDKEVSMVFQMEPTVPSRSALRTQDYLMYEIVRSFKFMRPLYFALTTPPGSSIGLKDFGRIDGLAYKILPVKGYKVVPEILRKNLYEKFKFRNLNNPDVYYNREKISLAQNLKRPFMDLVYNDINKKNPQSVLETLDKMSELMPEEVIPFLRNDIVEQIGLVYYQYGRPEEYEKRLDYLLKKDISDDNKYKYARGLAFRLKKEDKAIPILKEIIDKNPEKREYLSTFIMLLEKNKKHQTAFDYINAWIENNPDDKEYLKIQKQYKVKYNFSKDTVNSIK